MFAVASAIEDPKIKIDLTSYFVKRPPGVLHCTAKYTDFGKAAGAEEYAQQEVGAALRLLPIKPVLTPVPTGDTQAPRGVGTWFCFEPRGRLQGQSQNFGRDGEYSLLVFTQNAPIPSPRLPASAPVA